MATTNEAKKMERGVSYVKGIGNNLDTLQGRDVILVGYASEPRTIRGNDTTLLNMQISEVGSDEVVTYHAFSKPLADRLGDIPDEAFPVVVEFFKDKTAQGFNVWSIR